MGWRGKNGLEEGKVYSFTALADSIAKFTRDPGMRYLLRDLDARRWERLTNIWDGWRL